MIQFSSMLRLQKISTRDWSSDVCSSDLCHERMIKRASDRDTWKLEHWDEYINSQNFNPPTNIKDLFIFENSSEEEYEDSIKKVVKAVRG